MNIDELQQLYSTNSTAKVLCEHMAARQKNQSETKLKRILVRLRNEGSDIKKSDMIAVFRKLQELAFGQYIEGRHGYPSRFLWSVGSRSACVAATGESIHVQSLGDESSEVDDEPDMLTHMFHLRADLPIEFSLPMDLTPAEAERLATYMKSLPLEEYE